MNRIYEYFKKMHDDSNIGHAFLIGNINFDDYKSEIEKTISDFILNDNINIEDEADILIVRPENRLVSKDQVKDLLDNISVTSQSHGKKVYIILEAENMSPSVYNTLLKTIEEPKDNIIAFLITSNIDGIKDTIKSRCQTIMVSSNTNYKLENIEFKKIALDLLKKIESDNQKTIATYSQIYKIISDRDVLCGVLQEIFEIYVKILDNIISGEKEIENEIVFIKKNNNVESISKKILVVDELIIKNNNYISKNLIIDKLIIDLWRSNQ